ncbi:MAG: glycosyltransferase family 2 protein [Vicinamibacterales bacterium]
MMQAIFWSSAALVLYVYAGYPLLLAVWARVSPRRVPPVPGAAPTPPVSIVIAVRNEAARLGARVENLLGLDYPGDRQVIVVCDGSTDDPAAALPADPRVELVRQPARGKAAALNAGVARARHDLLVFADARQRFAPGALRALAAPFRDPRVGAVTGELLLASEPSVNRRRGVERRRGPGRAPDGDRRRHDRRTAPSAVADGVGLYWQYEKALRRLESAIASTLGATGAIYAMRRSLWRPLPADTILDDVLAPMRAVLDGSVVVFEDRAKAVDQAPAEPRTEMRRKIRTLAGNVQILWLEPRLLLPFVNPVWLQYVSHKLGRLLVPYGLAALLVSSIVLAGDALLYAAALAAQLAFYALGGYGAWLSTRPAVTA